MQKTRGKFSFIVEDEVDKRRCIKCGVILPRASFKIKMRKEAAEKYVLGWTDVLGRFHRGYKRIMKHTNTCFNCPECRKPAPKPTRPEPTGTFKVVMDQMAAEGRRNTNLVQGLPFEKKNPDPHARKRLYLGLRRALLVVARERARSLHREHKVMPYRWANGPGSERITHWHYLLTKTELERLKHAHAGVNWYGTVPKM